MTSNLNRMYQQQVPGLVNRVKGSNQGAIHRYMNNLMGGQKSLLDDYVKRSAGAGIRRGGMNVVGGSPLESNMALQATRGLASQYGANYGQAVNHANQDRSSQQQLLSQLMSGVNSSAGYDMEQPPPSRKYGRNRSMSGQEMQALARQQAELNLANQRSKNQAAYDRFTTRSQAEQDRSWELQQRNWQRQDREQHSRDDQTARMREDARYKQAQADQATRFNDQALSRPRSYRTYQSAAAPKDMVKNPAGSAGGNRHTPSPIGNLSSGPRTVQTAAEKQLAEFQPAYQKRRMLNELEQQAQQTRQSKLQTQSQELQLSGDRYKQNAWIRAQNPYIQSMNAFLGLGGMGYGGMNNARLGQARIAADVWAGLTKPSSRNFSWSSSTSVSGPRNSYKS